jgi:hypothetical protein
MAAGVVSNPLTVSLATADFQIFGSTGIIIPNSNSNSTTGLEFGIVRFNPDTGRIQVNKSGTWRYISDEQDIGAQQFQSVGAGSHYYTDSYVVIEKGGDANTVSLLSVGLSIQDPEPTVVLRNLSSVTGNSALFMTGGTGNTDPSAVNGFQIKTVTGNSSIYDSSMEINPIIQGDLSTTMNSITLTPYGMEIVPAVISITGSGFTQPTLKIRGSAHTTETALTVDKEDVPGVLPASFQTDSNKIASFNYTTTSVMDILGSGKVKINSPSIDSFFGVKGVSVATVPNYIASIEQGSYSGTNMSGMYVAISTATVAQNIAVFDAGLSGASRVSAARIDGSGNMFVNNKLSVGTTIFAQTALSVPIVFSSTVSSASVISSNISASTLIASNLSVVTNLSSPSITVTNISVGNVVADYTVRANGTVLQGKNIEFYDGVDNTYMQISGGPNNGDQGFIQGYTGLGAAYPIVLQPYGANVGIGLAPSVGPSATLHVAGDAYINTILGGTSTSRPTDSIVNAFTTTINGVGSYVTAAGRACFYGYVTGTSTSFAYWVFDGAQVGSITTNGTATIYGTTSDYRLKKDVAPMISQLERISKLKPVNYNWKNNKSPSEGFIAHELQEIYPDAVHGEKDQEDEDGKPVYQNIDVSFIVPSLVAAVQELKQLVQQQSQEIAFLKSQLT